MFNVTVSNPAVSVDHAGRPQEIRAGRERLRVSALEAVRDETAAYPMETGPRTMFIVRVQERRYRLVHLLRQRHWIVEPLDEHGTSLSQAA